MTKMPTKDTRDCGNATQCLVVKTVLVHQPLTDQYPKSV